MDMAAAARYARLFPFFLADSRNKLFRVPATYFEKSCSGKVLYGEHVHTYIVYS